MSQKILNSDWDSPDFAIFKELYRYYCSITVLLAITYFVVYDPFFVSYSIIAVLYYCYPFYCSSQPGTI